MIESIWPLSADKNLVYNFFDNVAHKIKTLPGFCNICGKWTVFNTSQKNFREHVPCFHCGSVNRQRQIVAVLLNELELSTKRFASIRQLPQCLTVWNAETTRALHIRLAEYLQGNYISSEFVDASLKSGELCNGILHVDMQRTHFEDESIDYILSGDVLEHIPEPKRALQESYRILRPGGAHIFTALFYHHRFTIEQRAVLLSNDSISHLMKPWFHDDPIRPSEGALVFNVFAPELLCEIEKLGFEARLLRLHSFLHGILGNNGIVIVARKLLPPDHARDWIFD